nr:retrovirus-related Pol polyprotein from transposon TNT 1-94 [Tanacetum cinerariifolium]GEZ65545.1 retrovirus-related Pol polyprotein from transposon TNT 1-94 [Tanacetum cinerariifolium]
KYNADILATNILLKRLPKDIYTLINQYTDAKDTWDNVKMLVEGSKLTKEDRKSQLYDDFEHFCQNKGETIHDYYVWFAKFINDIRNIKMTMSRMQLNSKFINNMLPERGRFVTTVKMNRGLRNSNYDRLYAYLKQHEQVQPALYNSHEIIKTNHVSTIVYNSEDTLEIAEITRKKINNKMKDPKCVKKKVNIASHDYSKENYLATYTPRRQLTLEQIFWPKDLLKMKVEALKETTASRPIKVLTVYPPNTPATLVSMLEAKVDQNVVNRKHDEIERKNLLIANDYLITDCLSKDVFYTTTDSVLTVSRFSDMHEEFNAIQKRIAELESKNSNLKNKIQNDDHDAHKENHKSNCATMPAVKSKVLATGDRLRLRNFVKKFIETVRFENDHFGAIMGYGDYMIGDSVISRVYYVEGLGHNMFSVGQYFDYDLEVAFRKHSCYV